MQRISTALGGESDFANEECVARRKNACIITKNTAYIIATYTWRSQRRKKITRHVLEFNENWFIQIVSSLLDAHYVLKFRNIGRNFCWEKDR